MFPADALKKSGDKFWSGAKRFPTAVTRYDPNDPFHVMFVTATANILAAAYGLVPTPDGYSNTLPSDHEWRSPVFVNAVVRLLPVSEYSPPKIGC